MVRKAVSETYSGTKEQKKPAKAEKTAVPNVKLFGRWANSVEYTDIGLQRYITVKPVIIPKNYGMMGKQRFHKSRMHIVERMALHMMVPGHTGKRHRITSGRLAGLCDQNLRNIEKGFEMIENKTKLNPIQVLVRAIENAAPKEEVTSYQMGSITARDAVITAPQRRVDKTLRSIAQGIYKASFGKKKSIENAFADEIIAAYNSSNDSFAIKEKERLEREATGAR